MNIFELTIAEQEIWKLVSDEDVDLETLEDTLQSIEMAKEEKVEGYAKFMKHLESKADAMREQEKRMSARRKAVENKHKWLKETLEKSFDMWGVKKIEGDLFTVSVQNNPPSVVIDDEEKLPEGYVTIEEVRKVDKKMILDAIKEGKEVAGCRTQQTRSLRIR